MGFPSFIRIEGKEYIGFDPADPGQVHHSQAVLVELWQARGQSPATG
jgi:hypothetical protein